MGASAKPSGTEKFAQRVATGKNLLSASTVGREASKSTFPIYHRSDESGLPCL